MILYLIVACGGDTPAVPEPAVDGDFAWSMDDAPADGEYVRDVVRLDDGDIWVVGYGIRRFDGVAWSDVPLPEDRGFDEFVRSVASAAGGVWTAGTTLRRFDGTAWTDESGRMPDPRPAGFQVAYDLARAPDGALWAYGAFAYEHAMLRDFAGTPTLVPLTNGVFEPFGFLADGTFLVAGASGYAAGFGPHEYDQYRAAGLFHPWIEVPDGVASWHYPPISEPEPARLSLVRGDPFLVCDQWGNDCVTQMTEFGSITAEEFGAEDRFFHLRGHPDVGLTPEEAVFVNVIDVVAFEEGLAYLLEIDTTVHGQAALVLWDGQTARLLPDRLAYRPAALIVDGEDLLVVARNGAVFRGVAR